MLFILSRFRKRYLWEAWPQTSETRGIINYKITNYLHHNSSTWGTWSHRIFYCCIVSFPLNVCWITSRTPDDLARACGCWNFWADFPAVISYLEPLGSRRAATSKPQWDTSCGRQCENFRSQRARFWNLLEICIYDYDPLRLSLDICFYQAFWAKLAAQLQKLRIRVYTTL